MFLDKQDLNSHETQLWNPHGSVEIILSFSNQSPYQHIL